MTKEEKLALIDRVLRGYRKEKCAEDGREAYALAEKEFSAPELAALWTKIRECESEMEQLDLERGC